MTSASYVLVAEKKWRVSRLCKHAWTMLLKTFRFTSLIKLTLLTIYYMAHSNQYSNHVCSCHASYECIRKCCKDMYWSISSCDLSSLERWINPSLKMIVTQTYIWVPCNNIMMLRIGKTPLVTNAYLCTQRSLRWAWYIWSPHMVSKPSKRTWLFFLATPIINKLWPTNVARNLEIAYQYNKFFIFVFFVPSFYIL